MLDQITCDEQLARLSGLDYFPSANGRKNLLLAMREFPEAEKLRAFITSWLRHETHTPKPADLYAELPPHEQHQPLSYRCAICCDSGLDYADFLVTWHGERKTSVRLTAEQADALWERHCTAQAEADALARAGKFVEANNLRKDRCLQLGTQMIYERSVPCTCRQSGPPVQLPPGK